ncbi:MAG: hypothetical protein Q7Q73_05020 [Verrucomicrobiota bacterium JB024]|nr:hypothetical protein [Verrucomicrobiota bacterium JB024]
MKTLITAGLLFSFALVAQAGTIVAWDVLEGNVTGSLAAGTIAENLDTGTGLNALSRTGVTYFNRNLSYASQNWNTTDTMSVNDQYIAFSVSAAAGYELTLESLDYCIDGGNLAPGTGVWGYTTDGGTSWTFSDTFNIRSNGDPVQMETWDFEDFTVSSGATVEFRFWSYGTTNIAGDPDASLATKPVAVDNITDSNDLILNGTVSTIPEVSSSLWLVLAGVVLVFLRRRS